MTTFLNSNTIDFAAYMQETDHKARVKPMSVYLDQLREELLNPTPDRSVSPPWGSMSETFAFRPGEVTVWAGQNGSGKSMITGQVALALVKQKQKVCIASFEMKPQITLNRMIRQFVGNSTKRPDEMFEVYNRFESFTDKLLYVYDQQGMITSQKMAAVCRYCAIELGMNHIFVDSLMKCVGGEDSYNEQKNFVDELTSIARDYDLHIHLVHHIRKLNSDETRPSKFDLRGSSAISDQVDNVLIMWRNKKKEHESERGLDIDPRMPDAWLMCEKQRNGEHEKWYEFWYHKDSQQFLERFNGMPMQFDLKGEF